MFRWLVRFAGSVAFAAWTTTEARQRALQPAELRSYGGRVSGSSFPVTITVSS